MFNKLKTAALAAVTAAVMTLGSGQAWAFTVPPAFTNASIDVGTCTGAAIHYEASAGYGIGNVFAIIYGGTLPFSYGVIQNYDSGTGVPNSQGGTGGINISTLTSADLLTHCGIAGATLTITGTATGTYASAGLIGYEIVGQDPNNGNALTTWTVEVRGVTGTTTSATKTFITPPNAAPTSNAGPDQAVASAAAVTLNGSASSDPDAGQTLTYAWSAPSGVTLSSTSAASPTFTAPTLAPGAPDAALTFSLTVTDNLGLASTADTVTISVVSGLSVVLTGGPAAITGTTPFAVTATFAKDVTGFNDWAHDVTVTNGAVTGITGGPAVYTLQITPTGNGDVSVSIPAAAANEARADSVVNPNTASNTLVIGNRIVDITKEQIAAFMLGRANQLASNQPGLTHFLMGAGCSSLNADITEKSGTVSGCVTRGHTWADISGAWSGEGSYTLGTVGAHRLVNPSLLFGGMVQFDGADDPDNNTSGRGWMVGPYLVAKTPSPMLYFEGRLLYGQTDNEIRPLQTYTDKFRTERWLAQVRATGAYKLQSTTLMPLLDVTYTEDRQKTYTDSLGNAISTQKVDLMQVSAGLDFSTPIAFNAATFDLIGGIKGIYSSTQGAAAQPAFENWRGKAHLGLNYKMGPVSTIRFLSFYDGLGTRYKNYGANLNLYWKF